MNCVLHIGCEKTGTTSIQRFAADNRLWLQSNSIELLNSTGFPNATALAIACMDYSRRDHNTGKLGICDDLKKRSEWCTSKKAKIIEELQSIGDRVSTVLISAEYLSSKLHTAEEVMRIKKTLERGGVENVTVVVYLRRQIEVAISRQSTAIKSALANSGTVDLDKVFNLEPGNALFDYEGLMNRWEAVFGRDNVVVRLYDENELYQGDVNQDFYSHVCGLAIEENVDHKVVRENRSLSAMAQTCLAQLETHLDQTALNKKTNRKIMEMASGYLDSHYSGEPFLPKRADTIKFQSRFDIANGKIAQRWLQKEKLFSDSFDRYPLSVRSISADDPELTVLMAELFSHLANETVDESECDLIELARRCDLLPQWQATQQNAGCKKSMLEAK